MSLFADEMRRIGASVIAADIQIDGNSDRYDNLSIVRLLSEPTTNRWLPCARSCDVDATHSCGLRSYTEALVEPFAALPQHAEQVKVWDFAVYLPFHVTMTGSSGRR
jgi:hypothetical protein